MHEQLYLLPPYREKVWLILSSSIRVRWPVDWTYVGLHTHLIVKHHTKVMNSTSRCNIDSIDVDVRDINLASLLFSSNDYEFCFNIIWFQHIHYHPLFYFNHGSLDFVDCYISTILVNRIECKVQLVIIFIDMWLLGYQFS